MAGRVGVPATTAPGTALGRPVCSNLNSPALTLGGPGWSARSCPMADCERRPSRDRDDRRPVGELLVAVGLPGPAHPAGQLRRLRARAGRPAAAGAAGGLIRTLRCAVLGLAAGGS